MKMLITVAVGLFVVCSVADAKGGRELSSRRANPPSIQPSGLEQQNTVPPVVTSPIPVPAQGPSCDIRANNNAYYNGYNMISQTSTPINCDTMYVRDIYNQCFPNGRSSTPVQPAGLAFSGANLTAPTHVEFYTYDGGSTYQLHANDGYVDLGVKERSATQGSTGFSFVPLNPIPTYYY